VTLTLDTRQQAARTWFESLRDRICAAFEEIEREMGSDAVFEYTPWDRTDHDGSPGGGGVRGVMKGKVFEKVGVNVSTVGGSFNPEFAKTIHSRRRRRPQFLRNGNQPCRAHVKPACSRRAYEHTLSGHDQKLVRRRCRPQSSYPL
jgi:coproporphyrinogen III oxidase